MSHRYRQGVGELAPKLVLPPAYQKEMRLRLAAVEEALCIEQVEAHRREALGVVRGLELAQALDSQRVEQLYLLIDDAATARRLELEGDGGGVA